MCVSGGAKVKLRRGQVVRAWARRDAGLRNEAAGRQSIKAQILEIDRPHVAQYCLNIVAMFGRLSRLAMIYGPLLTNAKSARLCPTVPVCISPVSLALPKSAPTSVSVLQTSWNALANNRSDGDKRRALMNDDLINLSWPSGGRSAPKRWSAGGGVGRQLVCEPNESLLSSARRASWPETCLAVLEHNY